MYKLKVPICEMRAVRPHSFLCQCVSADSGSEAFEKYLTATLICQHDIFFSEILTTVSSLCMIVILWL